MRSYGCADDAGAAAVVDDDVVDDDAGGGAAAGVVVEGVGVGGTGTDDGFVRWLVVVVVGVGGGGCGREIAIEGDGRNMPISAADVVVVAEE